STAATNLNTQTDDEKSVFGPSFHDIQPTWTPRVDKTRIPARACWNPDHNMDNILLDIHWSKQHAFLRLSIPLRLRTAPNTSRCVRTSAYIFLYPERIDQLLFTVQPDDKPFYGSTRAFTFHFNRPPALILPKSYVSCPKDTEDTILLLRSLVQQPCLTIYANLPNTTLRKQWLQELCEGITKHQFRTISSRAKWKTLYASHSSEAEIIEGDRYVLDRDGTAASELVEGRSLPQSALNRDHAAVSELPAYQEIAPSIPTSTAKRKRPCDESSAVGQTVQNVEAKLATHERRLEEMHAAHERRLEEMHAAHERRLEEMHAAHERRLEEMYADRERKLRARLNTHMREIENLGDSLEERVGTSIAEGMDGVQDRVMDTITSMPIQVTLTFPTHPVY
ncbi:hypothetical protein N5P37_011456, partial [Trichoderma harzianum]